MNIKNEFKINEFLTLKLENNETNIYVLGKLFRSCTFLLLNIPIEKVSTFDMIDSIDEAADKLDHSMESLSDTKRIKLIPPEVEFWGHCSNLQVWYEHNYDTCLLRSNLAFPLLKALADAGDPLAKRVFKEEITKRFDSGYPPIVNYLIEERYHQYLTRKELLYSLLIPEEAKIIEELDDFLNIIVDIKVKEKTRHLEQNKIKNIRNRIEKEYSLVLLPNQFSLSEEDKEKKVYEKRKYTFNYQSELLKAAFSIENKHVSKLKISWIPKDLEIPESIGRLKYLQELHLNDNKLDNIPIWIKNLKNLDIIDLGFNNFHKKQLYKDKKQKELIEYLNKKNASFYLH
ncbi:MAG: hypothetical protein ACTSVV_03280 [Promethearchaeota archaeon]